MRSPPPVDVVDLFPRELSALLDLLRSLGPDQWDAPTGCPGWSVKDVAAHIVADNLGVISAERDGYRRTYFADPPSWEELIGFINKQNETWVQAFRRLSPELVLEMLQFSGERLRLVFRGKDLAALGNPVDWAGPGPAPIWLDVAREYTERWHHQQQIRDALNAPGLYDAPLFAPVLATFVRALPHSYRNVDAPVRATISFSFTGTGGGTWSLVRRPGSWELYEGEPDSPLARVVTDADTVCRIFTRGLSLDVAKARVRPDGDPRLTEPFLSAIAILA